MGDDDLDLVHAGHYRGMTTDATNGCRTSMRLAVAEPIA